MPLRVAEQPNMKPRIENERLFVRFFHSSFMPGWFGSDADLSRLRGGIYISNDIGRYQFFRLESFGERPLSPDLYFYVLYFGKKSFDMMVSEYRGLYISGEWWGLRQLWEDWCGERWILPYLLKWWQLESGYKLPFCMGLELVDWVAE